MCVSEILQCYIQYALHVQLMCVWTFASVALSKPLHCSVSALVHSSGYSLCSYFWFSCVDSPVHIAGASLPHSFQPSKVASLLPKRMEGGELVLEKLNSLQSVRRDVAAPLPSTSKTGKAEEWGRLCQTSHRKRSDHEQLQHD